MAWLMPGVASTICRDVVNVKRSVVDGRWYRLMLGSHYHDSRHDWNRGPNRGDPIRSYQILRSVDQHDQLSIGIIVSDRNKARQIASIGTYVILSEREIRPWQIVTPEIEIEMRGFKHLSAEYWVLSDSRNSGPRSHPSATNRIRTYRLASPRIQTWNFREIPRSATNGRSRTRDLWHNSLVLYRLS